MFTEPSDLNKFATTDQLNDKADKTQLAGKADSTALTNLANKDGSNIDVNAFSTHLASKFATAEQLAEKADVDLLKSYLTTTGSNMDAQFSRALGGIFAAKDGKNIDVDEFSTRLASKFATTAQLASKANSDVLANYATTAQLNDKADKTQLDKKVDKTSTDTFVKIDGTNAASHSDGGTALAEAILSVVKTDPTSKESKTVVETQLAGKFATTAQLADKANSDVLANLATKMLVTLMWMHFQLV